MTNGKYLDWREWNNDSAAQAQPTDKVGAAKETFGTVFQDNGDGYWNNDYWKNYKQAADASKNGYKTAFGGSVFDESISYLNKGLGKVREKDNDMLSSADAFRNAYNSLDSDSKWDVYQNIQKAKNRITQAYSKADDEKNQDLMNSYGTALRYISLYDDLISDIDRGDKSFGKSVSDWIGTGGFVGDMAQNSMNLMGNLTGNAGVSQYINQNRAAMNQGNDGAIQAANTVGGMIGNAALAMSTGGTSALVNSGMGLANEVMSGINDAERQYYVDEDGNIARQNQTNEQKAADIAGAGLNLGLNLLGAKGIGPNIQFKNGTSIQQLVKDGNYGEIAKGIGSYALKELPWAAATSAADTGIQALGYGNDAWKNYGQSLGNNIIGDVVMDAAGAVRQGQTGNRDLLDSVNQPGETSDQSKARMADAISNTDNEQAIKSNNSLGDKINDASTEVYRMLTGQNSARPAYAGLGEDGMRVVKFNDTSEGDLIPVKQGMTARRVGDEIQLDGPGMKFEGDSASVEDRRQFRKDVKNGLTDRYRNSNSAEGIELKLDDGSYASINRDAVQKLVSGNFDKVVRMAETIDDIPDLLKLSNLVKTEADNKGKHDFAKKWDEYVARRVRLSDGNLYDISHKVANDDGGQQILYYQKQERSPYRSASENSPRQAGASAPIVSQDAQNVNPQTEVYRMSTGDSGGSGDDGIIDLTPAFDANSKDTVGKRNRLQQIGRQFQNIGEAQKYSALFGQLDQKTAKRATDTNAPQRLAELDVNPQNYAEYAKTSNYVNNVVSKLAKMSGVVINAPDLPSKLSLDNMDGLSISDTAAKKYNNYISKIVADGSSPDAYSAAYLLETSRKVGDLAEHVSGNIDDRSALKSAYTNAKYILRDLAADALTKSEVTGDGANDMIANGLKKLGANEKVQDYYTAAVDGEAPTVGDYIRRTSLFEQARDMAEDMGAEKLTRSASKAPTNPLTKIWNASGLDQPVDIMLRNAVAPIAGSATRLAGKAIEGLGDVVAAPGKLVSIFKSDSPQMVLYSAVNNKPETAADNYIEQAQNELSSAEATNSGLTANSAQPTAQTAVYNALLGNNLTENTYLEVLRGAMQIAASKDDADSYVALWQMYNDAAAEDATSASQAKLTDKQRQANAAALALEDFEATNPNSAYDVSDIPVIGAIANLGGNEYLSKAEALALQVGYMLSGATVNREEAKNIGMAYVPQPRDSEEVRKSKLRQIRGIISEYQRTYIEE